MEPILPVVKRSIKIITVEEFLKLKPFQDQYQSGVHLVKQSRVEELRPIIGIVLTNPHTMPEINYKQELIMGNHRQDAADKEVAVGNLNPKQPMPILQLEEPTTPQMDSKKGIGGNHSNNTTCKTPQLINSKADVSVKVISPTAGAFDLVGFSKSNLTLYSNIAVRLGSVFNQSPVLFEALKKTGSTKIGLIDLYSSKSNDETKLTTVFDAPANIDLRNEVNTIAKSIKLGIGFMDQLRVSGLWKATVGNNTNLAYYILGLSLQGKLDPSAGLSVVGAEAITYDRFAKILTLKAKVISRAACKVNADSKRSLKVLNSNFFPKK